VWGEAEAAAAAVTMQDPTEFRENAPGTEATSNNQSAGDSSGQKLRKGTLVFKDVTSLLANSHRPINNWISLGPTSTPSVWLCWKITQESLRYCGEILAHARPGSHHQSIYYYARTMVAIAVAVELNVAGGQRMATSELAIPRDDLLVLILLIV
jgi:hypothetical protein